MYAINKRTGAQIRGTYERLHGVAEAVEDGWQRNADGSIEVDHEGDTEIFWDDSITEEEEGKLLYLDGNGETITTDDIALVEQLPASRE